MALQMRHHATDIHTERETTTGTRGAGGGPRPGSMGPAGAPKPAYVKEVLLTLRSRLGVQLEEKDEDDSGMARALRDNIRGQLEQINEALARIEQGKYGICVNCLNSIEPDRLVVRPYSTLCLSCQNRQDRGKLTGY